MAKGPVSEICSEFATLEKTNKSAATLATYAEPDWTPPIYNVWKQQTKTNGSKHFGNSEKDAKDERNKRIRAKWLACWTREEIAQSEGVSEATVSEIWSEFPDLEKLTKSLQTLATYSEPEWTPPIYNVWKQQTKTNGSKHFGNSEKDAKDERNKRIRAKWLACWTQEEIAEDEGISQDAVSLISREFPELEKLVKSAATLATYAEPDWTPPIYNVWKQQTKTNGSKHFGNSEKDAKDERNKRIRAKWLACWTQEEIAESEGVAKGPVSEICSEFATLEKTNKSAATLATYSEPDWTPPPTMFDPGESADLELRQIRQMEAPHVYG